MKVVNTLTPVLAALPLVLATPAGLPAGASSVFDFIPNVVGKVLGLGQQLTQWAAHDPKLPAQILAQWHPPHHHPHEPLVVDKTIYQFLSEDPKFSKIYKLVNFNSETIDLLNQTSTNITFFAPPDSAFPKPPHHELKHLTFVDDITESDFDPAELPLVDLLREVDSLDAMDDDDEKKERRRKIIKYIVGAVLSYHVLPQPLNAAALSQNTTYATNLTLPEGSLDGQALRLRISSAPFSPVLNVNLFSKIVGSEVLTGNGVIHVVSFPILPPPAVFTGQFNAPSFFSISTSALQRVGLTDEVDYIYVPPKDGEKGHTLGAGSVTFFAPSNGAFQRLPARLRFFLFSPFGHRALKKLLQYHIVPAHVVHSDYFHNATTSVKSSEYTEALAPLPERSSFKGSCRAHMRLSANPHAETAYPRFPPHPDVEYNVTVVVPTLLEGYNHTIVITKYEQPKRRFPGPPVPGASRTEITVSGSRVALADFPARNGAVHIIGQLLNPLKDHKDHDGHDGHHGHRGHHGHHVHEDDLATREDAVWADWEEWLPQWANED